MADLYDTGPIDFQDVEKLRADPYVRDQAGKFAPHPLDMPRPTIETRYYEVPAPRCPHGHFARWAAVNCPSCLAAAGQPVPRRRRVRR